MKYCGKCNAYYKTINKKVKSEFKINDTIISGEITILTCMNCSEEIYDKKIEISNDIILFDIYKKHHNLLTSKEIIALRGKYELSPDALSKILGFGLEDITKYEHGTIQDISHDNIMRLVNIDSNFQILWELRKSNFE